MNPNGSKRNYAKIVLVAGGLWAFLLSFLVVGSIIRVVNVQNYRRTNFVVKEVYYIQGKNTHYGATGTIEGQPADYSLSGELDQIPSNKEQLQSMVEVGREFDVLYNPGLNSFSMQGEDLGIIKYDKDYRENWKRMLLERVWMAFFPFLVGLVLFFYERFRLKTMDRKSLQVNTPVSDKEEIPRYPEDHFSDDQKYSLDVHDDKNAQHFFKTPPFWKEARFYQMTGIGLIAFGLISPVLGGKFGLSFYIGVSMLLFAKFRDTKLK